MSQWLLFVVATCLVMLIGDLIARTLTGGRTGRRLPSILAVVFALCVIGLVPSTLIETRAEVDRFHETVSVVLCYLSMVLGMMAEYGYSLAERTNARRKVDLMSFLMPIFASPIVFIPLLTIATDVETGGAFTREKIMVYLVAFQNGFFWRSFFDQSRRQATAGHRLRSASSATAAQT